MKVKVRRINANDLENLGTPTEETNKQIKRQIREKILGAFDIYKSNIYYGIITETTEEHQEILCWYQDLCDLKEEALVNIPAKIKKYE